MSRDLKLKMIFDMAQKATAPMRQVALGAKAMSRELTSSSKEMQRLQRIQGDITSFRKLKRAAMDTGRELEAAEHKVSALAREMRESEKPARKLTRAFTKAQKEAGDLKNKFQGQQTELQQLRGSLGDAGISTNRLAEAQRELRVDIDRTNGEIDGQKAKLKTLGDEQSRRADGRAKIGRAKQNGEAIKGAGVTAVAGGVGLGAPIYKAAQEAMTFESRLIDIRKVLDNIDDKGMRKLEAGLIDMSETVPFAAEGLGEIAAEGARAGIVAKDLLPFTENAAKMGAAFDISAGQAGAMVSSWQKGMDLAIPQTVELGDKINALTNKYGGAAAEVGQMVASIGPLGKVAGVANGEMAAMAQLMKAIDIDTRVGATGIKNFMLTLSAGDGATKKQAAAFDALGMSATEMSTRMQTDARGAIMDVLDAISALPKAQQAGFLTSMFGKESVAAIAPMLSNLDQLKANFDLVGDSQNYAGSMTEEFNVAMSKAENQAATAKNGIGAIGLELGGSLIPALKEGFSWVKTIGFGIAGWMREHPELTKAIGITVGAIAGLLIVVGGLAIIIGSLMAPFAMLRYSLMISRSQFGLFKIMLKGIPGKLGILKTALLATGARLKAVGLAALTAGKRFVIGAASMLKMAAVKTLSGGLLLLRTALFAVGGAMKWVGRVFLMNPIGLAVAAIAAAAYLIYQHWDQIVPFFQNLWAGAKQIFFGAWEGIKNLFLNYTAAGLVIKHWDKITVWFTNLWSRVKTVFTGAWASIKSTMSGWASNALNIGAQIISGLARGITAAPGAVWSALKNVVMGGVTKVKNWLGIKSPSRVFMGIGSDMMAGLNIGLDKNAAAPVGRLSKLSRQLSRGIATGGGGLAMAAASAAASNPTAGQQSVAGNIEIHIHGVDANNTGAVAEAVRRALEEMEEEKQADLRSQYRDDE